MKVAAPLLPYGRLLTAKWIAFPESVEPRRHVPNFTHPKGELPDGFFYCPGCNRLVLFAGWMTQVCPGKAAA